MEIACATQNVDATSRSIPLAAATIANASRWIRSGDFAAAFLG
jgi:hypothetical protein